MARYSTRTRVTVPLIHVKRWAKSVRTLTLSHSHTHTHNTHLTEPDTSPRQHACDSARIAVLTRRIRCAVQMSTNAIAWNPMEAFNFTAANEDTNLYVPLRCAVCCALRWLTLCDVLRFAAICCVTDMQMYNAHVICM